MPYCQQTGKAKLSAHAAHEQVRHTRNGYIASRCRFCGLWHVSSAVSTVRQKARDVAAYKRNKRNALDDD